MASTKEVTMRTAEQMRVVLENWERSGLTQKAFGEREGVTVTTLQYWRRRLKELDVSCAVDGFAPVRLVGDEASSAQSFEVRIGREVSISVPASFDTASLQRLVAAVREC
jgi:hypothetical protein